VNETDDEPAILETALGGGEKKAVGTKKSGCEELDSPGFI